MISGEHVRARRRLESIGRVGLAALELANRQWARVTANVRLEPEFESRLIELLPGSDSPNAAEIQ